MGIECTLLELNRVWNLYSHYPVITILDKDIILGKFSHFADISLGKVLTSELTKYDKEQRKNHVIKELEKTFDTGIPEGFIVSNIDVLFNPEYNIDILGYFINVSRNKKVIVLWPGEYDLGILSYAAPGYTDYKRYLIKDYNIIILRK